MTASIFAILESIGFTHPLHPAVVHIPMGMVIGCFIFGGLALYKNNEGFGKSAFHCSVVALVFVLPAIAAGFMDWQYFFGATLNFWFVLKMILAAVLTGLLIVAVGLYLRRGTRKQLFIVYVLCLACAGGLGFSGGEVIYGG